MSTIHFVGGEKGGVGKSVFSRLLSQYFLDSDQRYIGLDADQSHGTLSRFYQDFTRPINLDSFESTDQIMELALEGEQNVLIDLPAQSERFLDRWIEENGVLELCEEAGVSFVYWYVVDGGVDSSRLLQNFLKKYDDHLCCIVVKNRGCGTSFTAVESVVAAANLDAETQVYEVELPALHEETMRKIDELSFSFWGAENIKGNGSPHLSLMERQRTKVWARKAYTMFDGIFSQL